MDPEAISRSFKVVLLGEGAVGKTSLMVRYTENKFVDQHISTVQAAFAAKQLSLDGGAIVELAIWDTAGQERFHALGPIYYRDSHGALLVYDITDRKSFNRVKNWVKELRSMLADTVVIFIVGNKLDLERERTVPTEEAADYAQSIGAHFHECSAKTNERVDELFSELANVILDKMAKESANTTTENHSSPFQRNSGSRRSLRIADEEEPQSAERRRRKCCN